MIELPGVIESGMPRKNGQRKPGTTRGSPRRSRTAKALRISRSAVKSRCARGWGGWGRLSDDGSRQHNSSTSEDPWGGGYPTSKAVHERALVPTQRGITEVATKCAKGGHKPNISRCMPGAVLSRRCLGRHRLRCQPCSRIGENPPCGMIGRVEETSASSKPGPRLDLTRLRGARMNSRPYRESLLSLLHLLRSGSGTLCRKLAGRACLLCPGISDVNLFRYSKRVIDFNPKISDSQELDCT